MHKHYFSFLLRIFRPASSSTGPWRFSLQDTRYMHSQNFESLKALEAYLDELMKTLENSESAPSDTVNSPGHSDVGEQVDHK